MKQKVCILGGRCPFLSLQSCNCVLSHAKMSKQSKNLAQPTWIPLWFPRFFCKKTKRIKLSLTFQLLCIFCTGGYHKDLLKIIDADQLPAFLGGTMTDQDGNIRCPSKVGLLCPHPMLSFWTPRTTSNHLFSPIMSTVFFFSRKNAFCISVQKVCPHGIQNAKEISQTVGKLWESTGFSQFFANIKSSRSNETFVSARENVAVLGPEALGTKPMFNK